MKKHYKRYISLLLIVALVVSFVIPANAARPKYYVSDLKISYNYDGDEAKQALIDQGYTVQKENLNKNAATWISRKREVYIGYKTTTDPKQAITDVAMMSEQNGYSFSDYENMMDEQLVAFTEMAKQEMDLIKEFRVNYKNKNPLAIKAYESLNNYKEDDSGKLVGDYFLDESLTVGALGKFIMQIAKVTLQTFNQILTLAVAETTATNFMTRLSALSKKQIAAAKENSGLYDGARILLAQVPDIKDKIKRAESFMKSTEGMSEEDAKAKGESDPEWQAEMYYNLTTFLAAQNIKEAKIGDKSLYDLFMQEELLIKELYPLVSVMSKGQIGSVNFVGFLPLFQYTAEMKEERKQEVSETVMEKPEVISAYFGVDRAMFSNDVAVTRAAQAEMSATGDTTPLYGQTTSTGTIVTAVLASASFITTVALVATIVNLGSKVSAVSTPFAVFAVNAFSLSSINAGIATAKTALQWLDAAGLMEGPTFAKVSQTLATLSNLRWMLIGMGVAIVITIISTALLIWQIWDEYNQDYTKIPKIMLDLNNKNDENNFIRYDAVPGIGDYTKDTSGDLNGFVGVRWNALYTTKDPAAGKPLLANISVFSEKNPKGANLKGVHEFGVTAATDCNKFTFQGSSADPIFLFFNQDLRYNDKNSAGSVFTSQIIPPIIAGIAGIFLGFAGTYVILRKKKSKTALPANEPKTN